MFAVGAMLATQGLVGCGTDSSGTKTGTGGATGSGGATARGGATGNGGATARGGATGNGGATSNGGATGVGGSTVPRDGGRPDSATNRDTARADTTTNRDTARNDTATACGGEGEPCCAPDNTCDAGLTCQRQGGERICLPEEEPVDSGRRNDTARNDTARNDTARTEAATACGGEGEACCAPDNTCDDGLTCERQGGERICVQETAVDAGRRDTNIRRDTAVDAPEECGGLDEDCCEDRVCDDGLTCRGGGTGTCREAEADGGGGGP